MEEDLNVKDDALSAIGQNIRQLHINLGKQISALQGIADEEGQDDNLIVRSEKVMLDMFMEGKKILAYALKLLTHHNFIV